MILASYTEEEILAELIRDYQIVKRFAKKKADKFLSKVKKSGQFIRETEYDVFVIDTVNHNRWCLSLEYNQKWKIPWLFKGCCVVEGANKTKDYYILRGVNTDKPYFVKVTTHALKRFRERNEIEKVIHVPLEIIACHVFEHRETAICQRYVDLEFLLLLHNMKDADQLDDEMSYIFVTNKGVYYGQITPRKNYVFKTYISSLMGITEVKNAYSDKRNKWEREGKLLFYMILVHQYFNKSLYDEESLDKLLYANVGRDAEVSVTKEAGLYIMRP